MPLPAQRASDGPQHPGQAADEPVPGTDNDSLDDLDDTPDEPSLPGQDTGEHNGSPDIPYTAYGLYDAHAEALKW